MGRDKSLTDRHPRVVIKGQNYHYGREPEFGQYLIEHVEYAKEYFCFDWREDILAFLANLPESAAITCNRRVPHPDWDEVTPELLSVYMEQDEAYLRNLMASRKELAERFSKRI